MRKGVFAILVAFSALSAAHAVGLYTLIRVSGDDSQALCKGVSHNAPMQARHIKHKANVTTACRAIVVRLEKGGKVGVFGG